jgi:TPR repeat protein
MKVQPRLLSIHRLELVWITAHLYFHVNRNKPGGNSLAFGYRTGLGFMYYYGNGVQRDRVRAENLFQQAADHGNEDAKRVLECDRKGISIDRGAGLRGLQ